MKIYTKKGDQGQTSLFGGGTFPKDHPRIAAYGEVDELNSVMGCVVVEFDCHPHPLPSRERGLLVEIQKQLFILGAELASIDPPKKMQSGFIQMSHVTELEKQIDQMESNLKPLKQFVLPGGSKPSALLHLARTVCRRAERAVVALAHQEKVRSEVIIYLNRLSDYLFVMARFINYQLKVEDVLWEGILK